MLNALFAMNHQHYKKRNMAVTVPCFCVTYKDPESSHSEHV